MKGPLRVVVERGPLPGRDASWWDTLVCGHAVRFDGARVESRRCPDCAGSEPGPDDVPLFD